MGGLGGLPPSRMKHIKPGVAIAEEGWSGLCIYSRMGEETVFLHTGVIWGVYPQYEEALFCRNFTRGPGIDLSSSLYMDI